MQIYKVGGCIRDRLLGIPVSDNDFVVVGSTPQQMTQLGFKPVGTDFPVFLHPQTHEEYALARSEKKVAQGYHGFIFNATADISLTEDLARRDITINAIAEDEAGQLIDPFNGQADLKKKIIRHVSDSFVEDPLRVLRVARFSAKLNFIVEDSTLRLMQQIVDSGELKTLSSERVWSEIHKALMTKYVGNFFSVLQTVGALEQVLPEAKTIVENHALFAQYQALASRTYDTNCTIEERFALMYYMISNNYSLIETKSLIEQSHMSNKCKHSARLIVTFYNPLRMLNNLSVNDIYSIITHLDPVRRKERYQMFINLATIIAIGYEDKKTRNHLELLRKIIDRIGRIKYDQIQDNDKEIFIANIRGQKLKIIEEVICAFPES